MNPLTQISKSARNLPCTLIPLENLKLIKIQGPDTIQYLQGQLTCDLNNININQYMLAAHCNYQGKMISNMYVFNFDTGIALIEQYNICNKQITEMKKYAIFSKVKIYLENDVTLFGVAGFNSRKILNEFFEKLPNKKKTLIHNITTTILHFNSPEERFLLIIPNKIKKSMIIKLKSKMKIGNSIQWTALDIEAGYPIIHESTSEKLIPQEANMHLLQGISFNKGCYIGQEIIARTQYKNINKRGLYWLTGNSFIDNLPQPGNKLEMKINHSWKKTGLILMACKIDSKKIWIQAILNHLVQNNISLRIINDEKNILKLSPLPYQKFNKIEKIKL